MADCIILYVKSSNRITITLYDEFKQPVTDAVANLTIVDQNQEPVAGIAWPQALADQGNGVYDVTLGGSLEIVKNLNYWAQVTSNSPTRGDLYQEALCKAVVIRS